MKAETFQGEHNTTILKLLDKDRNEEDSYCDAVLQVKGEKFNVHRCLLGSLSSYFNKIFKCEMKEKYERTVDLTKFSAETIKTILDFFYTSKVTVTEENTIPLLEAADYLLVYELKGICSKFLISTLTVTNCLHLYFIGKVFNCKLLQSSSEEVVVKKFRKVVKLPKFKELSINDVEAIVQALDQKMIGSKPVYEGILIWVHHNYGERKSFFADLFAHVKLHLLPTEYLQRVVAQQELVKTSHMCKDHLLNETLYAMKHQNRNEPIFESSSSSENEDNGESEIFSADTLDQTSKTARQDTPSSEVTSDQPSEGGGASRTDESKELAIEKQESLRENFQEEMDAANHEKKIYDRAFLMQFRFDDSSLEKPLGLPTIEDIIMDVPIPKSSISNALPSVGVFRGGSDFIPNWMGGGGGGHRPGRNTSRGARSGGQQRGQGGNFMPKIIKKVSIQREPELSKAENAWKPSKLDQKSTSTGFATEKQTESRGGRMGSRGSGGHNVDDGWTKVGLQQKPIRYDPQKMKLSKQQFDESNVTLGPSRGSGGHNVDDGWTKVGLQQKPIKYDPQKMKLSKIRACLKEYHVSNAAPALDEATLMKKIKSTIAEFLHLGDVKEATECFDDLKMTSSQGHLIVQTCLEASLEKSSAHRANIALLLCHLVSHSKILPEQYVKGVINNMELAIDLELDLPKVWSCLAELVAPIFSSSGGKVKLACLTDLAEPLLEEEKADIFVVEILKKLTQKMTVDTAVQYWNDSNLKMERFFKRASQSNIVEFLQRHNLEEFYVSNVQTDTTAALSKTEVTFNSYVTNITKQLDSNKSQNEIFEWIEANVNKEDRSQPIFIRALTSAICHHSIKQVQTAGNRRLEVDKHFIQRHSILLKKYIDDDNKELQAVYALQKLFVDLEQPPNILKLLFDYLYDEDVISEQTFFKWKRDATECEGKGVALLSVKPFFTWLREADVESESD